MAQQLLRDGARGEGRVFHQHYVGLGEGNFARDVAHEIPEFLGQQVLFAFDVEILVPRYDADFHVRFAEECRQVFGDQALSVPALGAQDIEYVGLFGRVEIVDCRIADIAGCDLAVLLGKPPLPEIGFAGKGPDDPPLGDALGADFVTQRAVEQFEQDEESQYEQERGEACCGNHHLAFARFSLQGKHRGVDDLQRRRSHLQVLLAQAGRIERREDREVRLFREVDFASLAFQGRAHGRELRIFLVEFLLAELHHRQFGAGFLGQQHGGEPLRHDRICRESLLRILLVGDVRRELLQAAGLLAQFPA